MANEITLSLSGSVTNGQYADTIPSQTCKITQTTLGAETGVRIVPTTAQAIPLGSVTTPGISYFKNLDPTNFVDIGVFVSGTFYPLIRLAPVATGSNGEFAALRIDPGVTPYWKADTATCNVQMKVYQA